MASLGVGAKGVRGTGVGAVSAAGDAVSPSGVVVATLLSVCEHSWS